VPTSVQPSFANCPDESDSGVHPFVKESAAITPGEGEVRATTTMTAVGNVHQRRMRSRRPSASASVLRLLLVLALTALGIAAQADESLQTPVWRGELMALMPWCALKAGEPEPGAW
jgi:hypothetical protein